MNRAVRAVLGIRAIVVIVVIRVMLSRLCGIVLTMSRTRIVRLMRIRVMTRHIWSNVMLLLSALPFILFVYM